MKILYTFLLILIPVAANSQDWKKIDSPTDKSLTCLVFLDSLTGWIAGDSSLIYKTTDGAVSWTLQSSNDDYDIKDIFFIDENTGWAVAAPINSILNPYALLLNTIDGGATWEEKFYTTENHYFNSIYYLNDSTGWMGGPQGIIVYTYDSGQRWNQASIDTGLFSLVDIHKIKFYNDSFAMASGGHFDILGQTWISRDGGLNWDSQPASPDIVTDFHFFDSSHIIGVTKEIESYGSGTTRTTDGGHTWLYNNFGFLGPATTLSFRKPNEAWVSLSSNLVMIYSVDSGYTWNLYETPDSAWITEIQFTDSSHGFGVGEFGSIIKYVYDSTTSVKDNINLSSYKLYQNFPNPFNPESKIMYELPSAEFVSLIMYNALGKQIAVLVDEEKPAGIHEITLNASKYNLSSGTYFYRYTAGNYSSVKKMIYIK